MTDPQIRETIEQLVAAHRPDVEVYAVQVIAPQSLVRVLIDRPGGVDLECCETVTRILAPLRDRYALEVSSPGLERPLLSPTHYQRAVGDVIQVRLRELVDGRRSVRGRLVHADDATLVVVSDEGERYELPHHAVQKSNVVWNPVTQ
jgi:ribosome maturation factor RimP